MENKKVGWLILGISAIVLIIVLIFSRTLQKLTEATCSHGPTCTMYDTMNSQLYLSVAIVGVIAVIGLYIMFSKPQEKIIEKEKKIIVKEEKTPIDLSKLDKKEKLAVNLIKEEGGVMFQADLKEKLEIGKVGITRLLDKLEAKQILERKRRGMNNIVILK